MFSVLMYHEIREAVDFCEEEKHYIDVKQDYNDALPSPLFVTLSHFQEQMKFLKEQKYHCLSLNEVKDFYNKQIDLPEKSVLLTFDDCFQSIKEYAYPILKQYEFHAVAFVVTGWLHEKEKPFNKKYSTCLTEKDLIEMQDVFEYANHTHSLHCRESETRSSLMTSSDSEFLSDLNQCNSYDIIQNKDVFAYPFGLFHTNNVSVLKNHRFQLAFTCENGHNSKETDPLLLKRNAIPYFLPIEAFKKIVTIGD